MKLNLVSLVLAGSVIGDDSRMLRKREKMSRKMGYGDVGSLTARQGTSLCSLRSTDPKFQCCDNVDLQCYGCNQNLLAQGEKCDDQTVSASATDKRDCFCDQSCIIFSDCCDDHPITCQRKGIRPVSFKMVEKQLSRKQ